MTDAVQATTSSRGSLLPPIVPMSASVSIPYACALPAPKGPRDTEDMLTIGPNPTACNCHGHAHDCYYDPEVDRRNASQNQDNVYQGGGVCLDCQVG